MNSMKILYRGHEISVYREKCNAGYELLYWSIFRASDKFECASSYEDSAETVCSMVQLLKGWVDAELAEADPWGEKAWRASR